MTRQSLTSNPPSAVCADFFTKFGNYCALLILGNATVNFRHQDAVPPGCSLGFAFHHCPTCRGLCIKIQFLWVHIGLCIPLLLHLARIVYQDPVSPGCPLGFAFHHCPTFRGLCVKIPFPWVPIGLCIQSLPHLARIVYQDPIPLGAHWALHSIIAPLGEDCVSRSRSPWVPIRLCIPSLPHWPRIAYQDPVSPGCPLGFAFHHCPTCRGLCIKIFVMAQGQAHAEND